MIRLLEPLILVAPPSGCPGTSSQRAISYDAIETRDEVAVEPHFKSP
jgi:hypothetical protein